MNNTYEIHAWCIRPFITCLGQVAAASPEEAIAIARRQPEKLLEAAEECNDEYLWDEFAVYGNDGRELLRVLTPDARLREAASALLNAAQFLLTRWERGDLAEAARMLRAAVDEARPA